MNNGLSRAMHDEYYVVAHFYSVFSLAAVFLFFALWYYLFPKITGLHYHGAIEKLQFWVTFLGAVLAFFPQHFIGIAGMPRRIADFDNAYAGWNYISSIGAVMVGVGIVIFLIGVVVALVQRKKITEL